MLDHLRSCLPKTRRPPGVSFCANCPAGGALLDSQTDRFLRLQVASTAWVVSSSWGIFSWSFSILQVFDLNIFHKFPFYSYLSILSPKMSSEAVYVICKNLWCFRLFQHLQFPSFQKRCEVALEKETDQLIFEAQSNWAFAERATWGTRHFFMDQALPLNIRRPTSNIWSALPNKLLLQRFRREFRVFPCFFFFFSSQRNRDLMSCWYSWYLMISHDISWYLMISHDISWYLMISHDISWSCLYQKTKTGISTVPHISTLFFSFIFSNVFFGARQQKPNSWAAVGTSTWRFPVGPSLVTWSPGPAAEQFERRRGTQSWWSDSNHWSVQKCIF